ncbi:hypothetical protein BJB45_07395 [Halomonas huangheensis]|uniref:Uncharacterized protein n=1 Tax=Halomonas huangheensis TaxID=1178482 RepID=W1N1C7_9GAMM|nr:hypothetical protein BJB45_07395 [Halomonas huangheensis]
MDPADTVVADGGESDMKGSRVGIIAGRGASQGKRYVTNAQAIIGCIINS